MYIRIYVRVAYGLLYISAAFLSSAATASRTSAGASTSSALACLHILDFNSTK